jgi:Cu2+-containing amine oxidase
MNGHISSVVDKNFDASGPQVSGPHHPLASLSEYEIRLTATLIKNLWSSSIDIYFKVITLLEPPKHELLEYFDADHRGSTLPYIERKAWVNYYLRNTVRQFSLNGIVSSQILLNLKYHY